MRVKRVETPLVPRMHHLVPGDMISGDFAPLVMILNLELLKQKVKNIGSSRCNLGVVLNADASAYYNAGDVMIVSQEVVASSMVEESEPVKLQRRY